MKVVFVAFKPVGGVHDSVEVFPDVVFGYVFAVTVMELFLAPVGDVVVVGWFVRYARERVR